VSASDPFGLVGQVLDGQFRVDKLVGEGGFSAVYRGHHQGLDEPIAIKCLKLPAALGTSLVDTFVQRFRDESRILYRLSQGNLNVVRSIAAGTTQAPATGALVPYMVLEWLDGRSVQSDFTVRRTSGEKGRSIEAVVRLFDSAADGLAYAHMQGVAHRDLNPGNLFLANTHHGVKMKVLDFGVAKLMHDGALDMGPRAQTVGQIKIFAPAYGAPEQFDDRIGAVGSASDVYSFALILLEALRDRNVVEGTHLGEFAQTTCDPERRPTPRALGIDVPDEIEQAFARAVALDPARRWHNAGDFWQSLTIALKLATERKYENAARETPPLAIHGAPGAAGAPNAFAGTQPGPPPSAAMGGKKLERTLPLGASTPGFPRPAPGATRPRVPTTIGIPAPAGGPRAGAPVAAPAVPAGAARTLSSPGAPSPAHLPAPAGTPLAPPVAPARASVRPGASTTSSPRMPAVPNLPRLPTPPAMARPASNRPPAVGGPATARFPTAPAAELDDSNPPPPLPAPAIDDYEEEEATRVHAPAPEVLRTLALRDAVAARNAAAMAAARARPAAGMPPPPPSDPNDEAAALEAAARDAAMKPPHGDMHGGRPAPATPVPPSLGGTLMMSPAAHAPGAAPLPQGPSPQAQPGQSSSPQLGGLSSTMAMASPMMPPHHPQGAQGPHTPQGFEPPFGFTAAPPYQGSSMQGQSAPPMHGAEPLQLHGMSNAPSGHGQQGMGQPYGHGSAIVPSMHSQQQGNAPYGAAGQGNAPYGAAGQGNAPFGQQRSSMDHPFPPPSFAQQQGDAPAKPLPIIPIAIALGVLALGGITLGVVALRARRAPPPDVTTTNTSGSSSALMPVPVPVPVPVSAETTTGPTLTAVNVDAAPEPAPAAEEDAAPAAAAPSASAAPSAAPTAAPTTTATAPQFVAPPPAATTAAPKPAADPNAFNEGAARTRLAQANGVLVICNKGGVSGPGSASVTFANDGTVASVSVDAPYAGTKEGDCAAAQFRRAKVNPFTGAPQTVRHSFEVPK
jgi:serine/threonine-protein kinase